MKRKTASKALSLLLTLCMVLSLLPGMALTAGAAATEYSNATVKISQIAVGSVIKEGVILENDTGYSGLIAINITGGNLDIGTNTTGDWIQLSSIEGNALLETLASYGTQYSYSQLVVTNNQYYVEPAPAAPIFDDRLGGTELTSDSYTTGAAYGVGANGAEYIFAGWYDNDTYTGDAVTTDFVAGTTYYAKWTKNGNTVRTTVLDLEQIYGGNTFGATLTGGVYTNEAEGWTWDSNTKTLTLSGCTIDVQGESPAVNLPDRATLTTAEDTQNTLSNNSSSYAALVGMGSVTINGSGSISFSGYQLGLSAGEITINAPITAIATKQGGMAVYGGSITINPALRIMEPSGGKIVEGKGYYIADSSGNAAVRVVIGTAAPTFDDGLGNADCAFDTYEKGATNEKGYTFAGWFNGKGEELTSASAAQGGTTYTAKWTKNGKTVRTTSLDLTVISESNTLGATYNNGVYVNTAEGWTWMPGNNGGTLLLESCTIDTADSSGIKLNHMSVRIAMDGESSVTATGNNGCGIDQTAVGGMLEIAKTSGEKGSLTLSGRYRGICTGGPVTIQSGNVTATGSGGVDGMSLEILGGKLTANGTTEYGIYAHSGSGSSMTYGAVEIGEYGEVTATGDIGIVCGRLSVDGTLTAQGGTKAVWVVGDQGADLAPRIASGLVVKTNTEAEAGNGAYNAEQISSYKWLNIAAPKIPFFNDGLSNADCAFDTYAKGDTNGKGYTFAGWFDGEGNELTSEEAAAAGTTYTAKWTKNGKTVRTAALDLTEIGEENTFGATLADGVYTNADEGWSWNPDTKTLTLSGVTMDILLDGSSYIGICLPAGATVATAADTENAVSVRAANPEYLCGCAISGEGDITISGQGILQIVGVDAGICTDGNIAINAPIDVSITGEEIAAIYIESESEHSITIHDALDILTPTGGVIGFGGICITEADEATPARDVVIGVAVKYAVTYNTNGGSVIAPVTVTENRKLTAPAAPTKDGYTFLGWYKDAKFTNAWNFAEDTVTGYVTLYAKWAPNNFEVTGTVKDSGGNPVGGATVKAMQGDKAVATDETESDGTYSFGALTPGVYNIVATYNGTTKTLLVTITDTNKSGVDITMPDGNVNSALTVSGSDTPDVVVGGLAEEAKTVKDENSSATSVKVEMTVESKSDAAVNAADKTNIETVAPGKTLEYFDIKVTKTVNGSAETMSTTTNMMEIIIPYDMTGKSNITVYRNHGGSAAAFTRLSTLPGSGAVDGTYYLDTANHLIYVYTKNFSTYAIGYTVPSSGGSIRYPITLPDSTPDGGKISVSPKSASKGSTVTITVTSDEGYELEKLTVTDKDGKEIAVTAKGDGKYTFTMPDGKVTVSATFVKKSTGDWSDCPKDDTCSASAFSDLDLSAWYHDGVHYCLDEGLMNGVGDGKFAPGVSTSRAMLVTILWRLEGSPVVNYAMDFTDVADGTWYTEAVRWAESKNIVGGYGNGYFGPTDVLTREQAVSILYRYAQYKGYDVSVGEDTNILSYGDAITVAEYAIPAMQWACSSGLIEGIARENDMILDPKGSTTRAQMATMVMRFCAEIVK